MNETNKKQINGLLYSWWAKTLVILLALIMTAMACMGAFLIARNLEVLTVEESWSETEYADSKDAYMRVMEHTLPVINSWISQSAYMKNGVFDGDATVDIMNTDASDDKKNEHTSYKLKDLVNFSHSGKLDEIQNYITYSDELDFTNDEMGNNLIRLEDKYDLRTYFRDESGQLYGVSGEDIVGISNTSDLIEMEYGDEEVEALGGKDKIQGPSSFLYVINKDGSARQFVYGNDKSADLIYTSRADAMARLMDTSELDEGEDISKYYGVYGERFCYLYTCCRTLEVVKPLSGKSLASYALTHPYDFSILDAYELLITTAQDVLNAYEAAERTVHMDDSEDISLVEENEMESTSRYQEDYLYYYYDQETKEILSNVSAWKTMTADEVFTEISNAADNHDTFPYVRYSFNELTGSENFVLTQGASADAAEYVNEFILDYLPMSKNSYELIILANPEKNLVPQSTFFTAESMEDGGLSKDSFRNGVIFFGLGCAMVLVLFIISMIQVANPAGLARYGEDGKRNYRATPWTRNIPICLLLLLFAAGWTLWGLGVRLLADFLYRQEVNAYAQGLITMACVAAFALFLWNILTLLAKIKTRSLWKNSILAGITKLFIRLVKGIYFNRKACGKVLLIYGLVSLLAVIGLALVMEGSEIGVLILFLDWGLLGFYLIKKSIHRQALKESIQEIAGGNLDYQIGLDKLSGDEKEMAECMNNLKGGMQTAINEQMKSERMKTDLITNVSHDIKTPLTSIINYVDLLKREHIQDEKISGYIDILDSKSARLKQLTEDLVEASKISSGNIVLDCVNLDLGQLIQQVNGEFLEKFENRNLDLVCDLPEEPMIVYADGRRISRVFENLYNNAAKYAMPGTRVYVNGSIERDQVTLSIKNISEQPLNVSADELMERFVRGDVSRSTEGSGLGLEIARNLTLMQNGQFDLYVDGDLFRVTTTWKRS